ncbi:MAG: cellulase (glycosyl hydrolase family 5) [Oscillospiraceae bacterium]
MKTMNKITAVFTAVMMMMSFAACGDSDEPAQTSAETSADVQTEAAADGDASSEGASAAVFTSDGSAKVTVSGNTFMVGGSELWINGVNTPWDNWNDFGSNNFDADFWDSHFAELEESGINASRVWINCSPSMNGVWLKSTGEVKSVNDKHWQDVDTLLQLAEKHHIYIMATLISFDHFKDSNTGYDTWRAMLNSDDATDSFVNEYVIPFCERYDSCDYLWSIDLCNEPDWIKENAECGQIGFDRISNYFAKASAAIHEHSDILVTVGMGMVKYNSDGYDGNYVSDEFLQALSGSENSYLDFYSTHYYTWEKSYMGFPFDGDPEAFKLDGSKPCVIGETSANADSGWSLTEEYEGALNNGWQGVMAWTSNGVDDCGDLSYIKPAAARILELAPEKVHPLEG